jgi:hypothetical protein
MPDVAQRPMKHVLLWSLATCIAGACGKDATSSDATTTPPVDATPAVANDDAAHAVENDDAAHAVENDDALVTAEDNGTPPASPPRKAFAPPTDCDFGTLGAESPEALMRQVLLTVKEKPEEYPSIIRKLRPERCAYFGALWEFRDSRAADAFDAWTPDDRLGIFTQIASRPNRQVAEFVTGDVDLAQVPIAVKRARACVESETTRREICQFLLEIPSPKGTVTLLAAPVLNRWFLLQVPVMVPTRAYVNEQIQLFAEKVRQIKAAIESAPDAPVDIDALEALNLEQRTLSTRVMAMALLEPQMRDPETGSERPDAATIETERLREAETMLEGLRRSPDDAKPEGQQRGERR